MRGIVNLSRNLLYVLTLLSFTLLFRNPVYGAEACKLFELARQATFESGTVQLSGTGIIAGEDTQKHYQIVIQIRGDEETRLRLSLDGEVINLILTDGNIYNDQMIEQKAGSLFAKLVSLGVLDPFFMLEILSGKRSDIYSSYMTHGPNNTLQLTLSPAESAVLYEHWTADFHSFLGAAADGMSDTEMSIAEGLLRQILTALEINVNYTFHLQPDTFAITHIDIRSEIAAPEIRSAQAVIHVSAQNEN